MQMENNDWVYAALRILVISFHKNDNLDIKLEIAKTFISLKDKHIHLFEDDTSGGVPNHEVWRNCKGWESIYQVSNFGRIKRHEGFFIKTTMGRTMAVYKEEMIRTKRIDPAGYVRTSFWMHEKAQHLLVHRLVAIHFVPNPTKEKQVLHIDDNPSNPHFNNLRWGSQADNINDCVAKNRGFVGSKNGNSKLKESDVYAIREMTSAGIPSRRVAEKFGVAHSQILSIKNRKNWAHLK